MNNRILVILIIPFCLFSCEGYENKPIAPDYISSLNDTILKQHTKRASFTHSPEEIVKHLFPPVLNEIVPTYKTIKKSATSSIITIETGPNDDELIAERYNVYFKLKDGLWTITDLKHEQKWRR